MLIPIIVIILLNLLITLPVSIIKLKGNNSFKNTHSFVQKITLIIIVIIYMILIVITVGNFIFASILIFLTYPLLVLLNTLEVLFLIKIINPQKDLEKFTENV